MNRCGHVVSVGRFEPRWFFVEAVEDRCFVGRYWTRRDRSKQPLPHWSQVRSRVSVLAIDYGTPADPKPHPPKRGVEAA